MQRRGMAILSVWKVKSKTTSTRRIWTTFIHRRTVEVHDKYEYNSKYKKKEQTPLKHGICIT